MNTDGLIESHLRSENQRLRSEAARLREQVGTLRAEVERLLAESKADFNTTEDQLGELLDANAKLRGALADLVRLVAYKYKLANGITVAASNVASSGRLKLYFAALGLPDPCPLADLERIASEPQADMATVEAALVDAKAGRVQTPEQIIAELDKQPGEEPAGGQG